MFQITESHITNQHLNSLTFQDFEITKLHSFKNKRKFEKVLIITKLHTKPCDENGGETYQTPFSCDPRCNSRQVLTQTHTNTHSLLRSPSLLLSLTLSYLYFLSLVLSLSLTLSLSLVVRLRHRFGLVILSNCI